MQAKECLFCLNEVHDGVQIFGQVGRAVKAQEIIVKYFWFDLNEDDSAEECICFDCWLKVRSFHEFYQKVETLHDRYALECNDKVAADQNSTETPTIEETDTLTENLIESDTETEEIIQFDEIDETKSVINDFDPGKLIGLQIDFDNGQSSVNESQSNTDAESSKDDETVFEPRTINRRQRHSKDVKKKIEILEDIIIPNNIQRKGRPLKIEPEIDHIECFMCHQPSKSFQSLRRHFLMHNPEASQQFACHICSRIFPKDFQLESHMKRVHTYFKSYQEIDCPICDKRMKYVYLKSHIAEVHENLRRSNETFICEICGKELNSARGFMQHALTHTDAQLTRVQCDICDKWLKNKFVLRAHKQIHDDTQFKCSHCNKIKPNIRALRSHIAFAHSVAKHQCHVCNKSFSRPTTLKEHMAIHTGISLYNCKYCSKSFKNSPNMYKHLNTCHKEEWSLDRAKKN